MLESFRDKYVVCSEIGQLYQPDIAMIDRNLHIREYEIKVDKYDLKRELDVIEQVIAEKEIPLLAPDKYWFEMTDEERAWRRKMDENKFAKHRHYLTGDKRLSNRERVNYFYFVISEDLYEGEKERIDKLPYGVIDDTYFTSIKKPRRLCSDKISAHLMWCIAHCLMYKVNFKENR